MKLFKNFDSGFDTASLPQCASAVGKPGIKLVRGKTLRGEAMCRVQTTKQTTPQNDTRN